MKRFVCEFGSKYFSCDCVTVINAPNDDASSRLPPPPSSGPVVPPPPVLPSVQQDKN